MTEGEELAYSQGKQMMAREMLAAIIPSLPEETHNSRLYIMEIRAHLRSLCEDFGDNDWDDTLHLGDVIDKHLGRHLHANFEPLNSEDAE